MTIETKAPADEGRGLSEGLGPVAERLYQLPGDPALPGSLRSAYSTAKKNAAKRGIAWQLTPRDLAHLWRGCGGRCEISGIQFDDSGRGSEGMRRPWAASIDRCDSGGPYSRDNCRIVCVAANLAMNEWGATVLYRLAGAIVFKNWTPERAKDFWARGA